jgi:hypothetical protein
VKERKIDRSIDESMISGDLLFVEQYDEPELLRVVTESRTEHEFAVCRFQVVGLEWVEGEVGGLDDGDA